MNSEMKIFDFKTSPIEIEVKDVKFIKEFPKLLGQPHKANFYQLLWVTDKKTDFYIDFRKITINKNEVLIISPGQVCQFDVHSDYSGKMILFTASFFAITEFDTDFLYTSEIFHPVSLNKTALICPQLIGSLVDLLEEELKQPFGKIQTAISQSYLRVVLLEAERQLNTSASPLRNSIGRRFYNAVERYYRENRNAEYYIDLLGVSEKVLSKEVKTLTGKTPKAYIDSRIVLEAKRLLSYSSLSVKEIGFQLGFDEPTNFNKYFRKHADLTPLQFREM